MVGPQVREVYADLASLVDEQKASVDQIETDATDAHTRTANGIEQVIHEETSTRPCAATPRSRRRHRGANATIASRTATARGAKSLPRAHATTHACSAAVPSRSRVSPRALGRRTVASVLRPRH